MKNQQFGVEIEMTGITRSQAAEATAQFFGPGSEIKHRGGRYDEYRVTTPDNREWKFLRDGSILAVKKENGQLVSTNSFYSVELVSPILTYQDLETLQELVRELRSVGAVSDSKYQCGIHIHIDGKNHTPTSLKNLVNLMASKEELLYKSLEIDPARMKYCKKVNENLIATINKEKPKTLEALADIWYADYGVESRKKHYHSSRYHGLNLHSVFDKGTVEFRLFNGTTHAGKIKAYIQFCLAVSHQAISQKSASARRTYTDNEKYTFRCWLLRLGLNGNEFKTCRLHLLAKLEGNSAWRNAA